MPEPATYVGAWQDDVARLGVLSCSAEDPDYKALNAQDDDPAHVSKATSPTATWSHNPGGTYTVRGLAIINHNWVGRTVVLSSSAGTILSPVPIPPRVGGQCTNVFIDFAGLPNVTGSTFSLAVSGGTGNPQFGRLVLMTDLEPLRWQLGVQHGTKFPANRIQTYFESDVIYPKGIRRRWARGTVHGATPVREFLETLQQNTLGEYRPFLYVRDSTVSDAWWVRLDEPGLGYTMDSPTAANTDGDPQFYEQIPFAFTEVSMGLPL